MSENAHDDVMCFLAGVALAVLAFGAYVVISNQHEEDCLRLAQRLTQTATPAAWTGGACVVQLMPDLSVVVITPKD